MRIQAAASEHCSMIGDGVAKHFVNTKTNPNVNPNPNHKQNPRTENSMEQVKLSVHGDGKYHLHI